MLLFGVVVGAVALRWFVAPEWNFIDAEAFFHGGQSAMRGTNIYVEKPGVLAFNYPPFAAMLFIPLALIGILGTKVVLTACTFAAYAVCLLALKRATSSPWSHLLFVALAGLALEPVVRVMVLGQIGIILMALVLTDIFLLPPRFRGCLIGLAAAVKLTPAFFILYFFIRREFSSAARVFTTTLACVTIGFVFAFESSNLYWLGGMNKLDRFPHDLALTSVNQSIRSLSLNLAPAQVQDVALWVASALVVLLSIAAAKRRISIRDDASAVILLAAGSLSISPISWTHHWVWVVPAIVVLLSRRRVVFAVALFMAFYLSVPWVVGQDANLAWWQVLLGYPYILLALSVMAWTLVPGRGDGVSGERAHVSNGIQCVRARFKA